MDSTFDELFKTIAAATATCTILVSYGNYFIDGRIYLIASTLSIIAVLAFFYDDFYHSLRYSSVKDMSNEQKYLHSIRTDVRCEPKKSDSKPVDAKPDVKPDIKAEIRSENRMSTIRRSKSEYKRKSTLDCIPEGARNKYYM